MGKQLEAMRHNLKEGEKKEYLKEHELKEAYQLGIVNRAEYRKILTRMRKKELRR